MAQEAFGTETFEMEGLEMASEVHDAKELGAEVFHIEELAQWDNAGVKQDVEVQEHMHGVCGGYG